ncbi:MAG: homoserine O-acetyltransferase [Planctomycetes bacterium]|nr:homoserine O-acetyltransferase [Planctomycetota bacterium]
MSDTRTKTGSVGIVETKHVTFDQEMELESGAKLGPIDVAYETYGTLSPAKDNAILIVHALSGDAHAAGKHHPDDKKPGWWDVMIGPGKGIDTDKYFVICPNNIAGCKGSTGPSSTNPRTGKPYGLDFPMVTVGDIVNVQKRLVDHLGIGQLLTVTGGSMGGMQAIQWAVAYPERVVSAIPIASTCRLSPQAIAFNEVGRRAIMADPNWREGDYYGKDIPAQGLAVARMVGHITYLSDESMHRKFGRRLQDRDSYGYDFSPEFEIESYLEHQGHAFIKRFDANSYLYITKAMDYFDLEREHGSLEKAFAQVADTRFLVVSFTSDWLFPSYQSKEMVKALNANGIDTTYFEIEMDYGHDAFLLESGELLVILRDFLDSVYGEIRDRE